MCDHAANPQRRSTDSTATFTAAASGTPTPTVQWEVKIGSSSFTDVTGSFYSGATTDTLTITDPTASMNGYQYEAVFSNIAGSATTNPVALTVETAVAPSVTTQPCNKTVVAGVTTSFIAAASGTPTPTVQWEVKTVGGSFTNVSDNSVYSGATTGTLTITDPTAAMNGYQYEAVFNNSVSSATSNAATLTVQFAPIVTQDPINQTVVAGVTTSLYAAASGVPSPTVQWEVKPVGGSFTNLTDSGVYSGSSTGTLTITHLTLAMSGYQYEAHFSNSLGSATTYTATLTVAAVPCVTQDPADQVVVAGVTATFTAVASGTPTPTVQWEVNHGSGTFSDVTDNSIYSGSATGTLTITDPPPSMNGYQYEAVFTNPEDSLASACTTAATLTVETAPSVITQPVDETALTTGTATFTATASGNPAPSVQWEVKTGSGASFTNLSDTGVYSGSSTGTLTITDPTASMSGYQYEAVFTNGVSPAATTTPATLTVQRLAAVSVAASSGSTVYGQPLTVSATVPSDASGTLTFSDTCNGSTATLEQVPLTQAPATDLLGSWTGDGNTDDSSGYGNNGTWEDSSGNEIPGAYAAGNGTTFAQAMSFNGVDDFVDVHHPTIPTQGVTLEAWVYLNSYGQNIVRLAGRVRHRFGEDRRVPRRPRAVPHEQRLGREHLDLQRLSESRHLVSDRGDVRRDDEGPVHQRPVGQFADHQRGDVRSKSGSGDRGGVRARRAGGVRELHGRAGGGRGALRPGPFRQPGGGTRQHLPDRDLDHAGQFAAGGWKPSDHGHVHAGQQLQLRPEQRGADP